MPPGWRRYENRLSLYFAIISKYVRIKSHWNENQQHQDRQQYRGVSAQPDYGLPPLGHQDAQRAATSLRVNCPAMLDQDARPANRLYSQPKKKPPSPPSMSP
jgi:hypothetical protein